MMTKGLSGRMSAANDEKESRPRICRACNETYEYPVLKSPATRFYCPTCAELPAQTRGMFEKFNRRIKAMSSQLEKLEQRRQKADGVSANPAKND